MIFNEAYYFSSLKELKNIERAFDSIILKVKENSGYNPYKTTESKEIENNLKTLFNFEKVEINWNVSTYANMFTNSVTGIIPLSKEDVEITRDNRGFHFKNSKNKIGLFTIETGLITFTDLSAKELTAVLIHEVGHNFYITDAGRVLRPLLVLHDLIDAVIALTGDLSPVGIANAVSSVIQIMLYTTRSGRRSLSNFAELDEKKFDNKVHKTIGVLKTAGNYYLTLANMFLNIFRLPVQAISATTTGIASLPYRLAMLMIVNGYKNEKFADNFATMYGYGEYITSANIKLSKASKTSLEGTVYGDVPIVNVYYGTLMYYITAIMTLADAHPTTPTRVKEQKRYLEACLDDKNIDSKYKAEIKKQINKIDSLYNTLYTAKDDDTDMMRNAYYNLRKEMGISDEDWKEILFKTKNYDYDNVLKDRIVK